MIVLVSSVCVTEIQYLLIMETALFNLLKLNKQHQYCNV